ncbi:related to CCR4-NOT transcription complex subunit 7 [Rhynchosporium secalis]|uniref:poly(A)-specific ribonuclease n=1 Tax=Rhynchosporium secalis TaxID=38038 RepID=A0A1E1MN86_RHYSE|nr:related to CCR4-NOT transcription complex subunit 7 [Rhynchosporium secalis]
MPPPMQRFGGAPNNLASHYQQYPSHSQSHNAGLPPPSLASNPGFMNANSMSNAFSMNGNAMSLSGGFGGAGLGIPGGTGLASQAAQMGFANANNQGHNGMDHQVRVTGNKTRTRDVWAGNLKEEMAVLRCLVDKFPYIAMDTEFPGLVARPMGSFNGKSDYHYQCLRCNVDLLKILQLGISLFTEDGDSPPATMSAANLGLDTTQDETRKYANAMVQLPTTWQFNFKFSLEEDMYSEQHIKAAELTGVDFPRLSTEGIEPDDFGSLFMSSGLVCDEDVYWVSFHGGYDFGYLMKLFLIDPLPDDEFEFDRLMKKFFPSIYDIKFLMKYAIRQHAMGHATPLDGQSSEVLQKFEQKSTLDILAESLKVKRQGVAHQAGSDSLWTGKVFFKMRERIFNGELSEEHIGKVWGLGFTEYPIPNAHIHSAPTYQHQQENVTPGQNGYTNGGPSTPNTGNAGLATPGHNSNGGSMGPQTPGATGAFGAFQYSSR